MGSYWISFANRTITAICSTRMQRSAWIFLAAIVLPSLGLAWLAVHSVRDQQVVLEHQEAIICQNITDALAKNVQGQMDAVRLEFAQTTDRLLNDNTSPPTLALNFNRTLREAWPMAEIGFAVDLNGEIYSPKPYDGPNAKTFRDENDRFLSNRENVAVYSSSNSAVAGNLGNSILQNNALKFAPKQFDVAQSTNILPGQMQSPLAQLEKNPLFQQSHPSLDGLTKDKQLEANADLAGSITITVPQGSAADLRGGKALATLKESGRRSEDDVATKVTSGSGTATAQLANANGMPQDTDSLSDSLHAPQQPASKTATPAQAAAPAPEPVVSPSENAAAPAAAPASISPPPGSLPKDATKAISAPPPPAPVLNLPTTPAAPVANTTPAPADASATLRASQEEAQTLNVPAKLAQTETPPPSSSTGLTDLFQKVTKIQRQVVPQQMASRDAVALSNTVPEDSDFRRVVGSETSGALARFLENKLRLMVWAHSASASSIVFGAQLDQSKLVEALQAAFQIPELEQASSYARTNESNYCVALLDDEGHPVALSRPGFTGDWKHPFVATEIGEALPHWEAALYLVDPQQISRTARTLQLTLGLIVLLLVAAIVSGGSLIAADVRRQVRLAQQKTDFVSNVSHELKTPLTSIRMFADLLAEKRVPDEERQATYLRIIAAEAARLTRLINNVLDFARLERGAPPGEHRACDLVEAAHDVIGTCQPHLEASGVSFRSEIEAETLPIHGDRDALAQIILNLVSNAEKYGGNDIVVRVRRQETAAGALGCVDVLDRGPGIPSKQVKTVFEPFHRLDDSLASGIPGSGLGLTLARRMARAHGGDVTYSPRAGGGSCFTLSVPLTGT